MKIIKEIEKSRLTEDGMNDIKGGVSVGQNCTAEIAYQTCGAKFVVKPCAVNISCGSVYHFCTGPEDSQKLNCPHGYWQYPKP